MKVNKILVPTDFSKYAGYAGEVALEIARKTGACVEYFHQTHIFGDWSALREQARLYYAKNFVEKDTAIQHLEQMRVDENKGDVEVTTTYGHGNLISNIIDKVENEGVDLIVMGTQGRSDYEKMLGSNTLKVLRLVPCPIITVKNKQETFSPKNIIFTSDFKPEAMVAFKQLLELNEFWKAKIHLFYIDVNLKFKDTQQLFQKTIGEFKELGGDAIGVVYSYPDTNIQHGINQIAKEYGVDLIAIGTHYREYDDIMYTSFITESIVNKAEVPVLSMLVSSEEVEEEDDWNS